MSLTINTKQRSRRNWQNRCITGVAILLILGGAYSLITVFTPWFQVQLIDPTNNSTTQRLADTPAEKITENRLYIPKIDINLPYNTGGAETMEYGAWWRKPENGDPANGGNFILSAHRFIMGLTPEQTLRKSPFYNVDRLQHGDEIIVDYNGKRYVYAISDIFEVKPDDTYIENRTEQPQLTLYSCTLGGANDGRNVFIAKLKP